MMREESPTPENMTVMRVSHEVTRILEGLTPDDYKGICAGTEAPYELIGRIIQNAQQKSQPA